MYLLPCTLTENFNCLFYVGLCWRCISASEYPVQLGVSDVVIAENNCANTDEQSFSSKKMSIFLQWNIKK